MKLHVLVGCPFCLRAMFTIEALGIEYELVQYYWPAELKTEAYLALNPKGEAPVLEVEDGAIYESAVIMRYLANLRPELGLNGDSNFNQSQVEIWSLNTATVFGSFIGPVIGIFGKFAKTKEDVENAQKALPEKMKLFEERLADRTFLVGHKATNADYCFISVLYMLFSFFLEEKERHKFPHCLRYYNNLVSASNISTWIGVQKRLAPKMYPLAPFPKEQELVKEVKKPEKKEQKPKEAKKEEEKKPEPKEETPAKPKEPESTFDLFSFKTPFVNEKDRKKVVDFAVENYDKNCFSFWYAHYDKHHTEGKQLIPFNNLLTNFCQRVSDISINKHLIAVHGIYGEEPELEIKGVWLWRSADFLEGMKDHPSNEYVKWTKLDPSKPEDRSRIEEYWSNVKSEEGSVEGHRCRTLKVIK